MTTFSSKYDAVHAGKAQFTPLEQEGYDCSAARQNATAVIVTVDRARIRCSPISRRAISEPLPTRPALLCRGRPDGRGYVANKSGACFRRFRRGRFLAGRPPLSQPSAVDARWKPLPRTAVDSRCRRCAMSISGRVPTSSRLRSQRLFQEPQAIVHFYNTRDMLPRCSAHDPGEGTTCWPAPETTENLNTKRLVISAYPTRRKMRSWLHADADGRIYAARPAIGSGARIRGQAAEIVRSGCGRRAGKRSRPWGDRNRDQVRAARYGWD